MEKIEIILTEILAIQYYEHDFKYYPAMGSLNPSWLKLPEEDQEAYREKARQLLQYPGHP